MLNKRLLKESSSKRFYIAATFLAPLLNSIFIVVSAYLLSSIVAGVFLKTQTLNGMKIYIILFLLNAAIKAVVNFVLEEYIEGSAEDIKESIREKTFDLIISSSPYKVKEEKVGEIVNIATDGIEMITPYYSKYIPQFFSAFIIPLTICISAAFVDRLSALIMIITYPIIPLFMILIGYKSKEVNEKQWKRLSILSSHFIEMLQGLSTLKIFGRSRLQEEKVFKVSEKYRRATMEVLKISFLSAFVLEIFSTISTAVVAVNLGLRLVYSKIAFANAFFILILAPDFYLPVRQLGLRFHASLNGVVAIEKIEIFEERLKNQDKSLEVLEIKEDNLEIEVKDLNFVYEGKKVLNNISFKINSGEKVAVIGESGSGKSTLINILSGFLKVKDNMIFINGKDINRINKEKYLEKITIVPQFPHVFNSSMRDNISLEHKDLDYIKLLNIYKRAKIDILLKELTYGDKTVIGEGEKVDLSGGEVQRIAIARAMVKNSSFIILDEPSSALDSESEELVTELMEDYFKSNTILIAAHRLNTIKAVNKILVLHEGCLIEAGTHKELMAKQGRYYRLIKSSEVEL